MVARLAGAAVWKYSRYYDSPQYWTEPGNEDVLLWQHAATPPAPGSDPIDCAVTVKDTAVGEQYELCNLADDPMELTNLYSATSPLHEQGVMAGLLEEQRTQKRLKPASGPVPGQPA